MRISHTRTEQRPSLAATAVGVHIPAVLIAMLLPFLLSSTAAAKPYSSLEKLITDLTSLKTSSDTSGQSIDCRGLSGYSGRVRACMRESLSLLDAHDPD